MSVHVHVHVRVNGGNGKFTPWLENFHAQPLQFFFVFLAELYFW